MTDRAHATTDDALMAHPVMPELIARYRSALDAWKRSPRAREAAMNLGWNERDYCDRFIGALPPIYYTATDTTTPFVDRRHHDAAFAAAQEPV